jgi:hypothetical protein
MAIDMGPRDGDYARYVEALTSGGVGEPGRVYKGARGTPAGWSLPRIESKKPAEHVFTPTGESITAAAQTQQGPTLAARSRKRTMATLLTVAAVWVAFTAANPVLRMIRFGTLELERLVPSVFMLFLAVALFKAAGSLRRQAKQAATTLPPLNTVAKVPAASGGRVHPAPIRNP